MKYCSINRLNDFEFHDASLKDGRLTENTFFASLRMLNIHKNTPQNSGDFDMEIELARITFDSIHALTFEYGRVWYTDENGNSRTDEPQIIHNGREAHEILAAQLEHGITLFSFEQTEDSVCSFNAMGDSPFFTFSFAFDQVTIEWDDYRGRAWYESDQWREYRRRRQEQSEGQEQS